MHVIKAYSVDEALLQGVKYLRDFGVKEDSRAGSVLVSPCPVTTVYLTPQRRVLYNPIRDANPFFHIFEALWLLMGRNDARWLDRFVGDFSARFAEQNGTLHGSYGYRWRYALGFDQLDVVVEKLKKSPQDRQCVLQMWDGVAPASRERVLRVLGPSQFAPAGVECTIDDVGCDDLRGDWRDRPCNTHVYLRVRSAFRDLDEASWNAPTAKALDIMVSCRSNDLVWGLAGSNVVQFSVLQEYLAARIGVGIGTYTQVSFNYHAYEATLDFKVLDCSESDRPIPTPMVTVPEEFDSDLKRFFEWIESAAGNNFLPWGYENLWFSNTAEPLYVAHALWKDKERKMALEVVEGVESQDWREATQEWMQRRMAHK